MAKKLTTFEVLERFKKVHGDKYDYSKVIYKGTSTKVEIVCPKHGSFWQYPYQHFNGAGCYNCIIIDQEKVLKRFKKVHGNKYDYSKVKYLNNTTKVEIICPEHGSFWQRPYAHWNGSGCKNCNNEKLKKKNYIANFQKVHCNKYNYSKVNYINSNTPIELICPKHGSFFIIPYNHISGSGCPQCAQENSESKGEKKVREFLEENNISYKQEVNLFNNYRFDFYLEDLNTVIEYDGKQHFEPVEYFGGLEGLKKTQERDKIKTTYCLENNIRIIRIGYFENIEEVLNVLIH
jgi:very-short-patch-repair endonuclease